MELNVCLPAKTYLVFGLFEIVIKLLTIDQSIIDVIKQSFTVVLLTYAIHLLCTRISYNLSWAIVIFYGITSFSSYVMKTYTMQLP